MRDFQRALADMTLDARLAAEVRTRGAVALAGYELSERERRRLEAVARQDGMSLNCSLARANRFGSIHNVFPMTCVLLERHLRELLDELWRGRRPDNYQLAGEEAEFAALVEGKIAREELAVEYLEEVFGYEKICWELALQLRCGETAAVERTLRFHHDPRTLLDALSRLQAPPAGLPTRDYAVTVRLEQGDLVAEWRA
jgi:hypothetical protein